MDELHREGAGEMTHEAAQAELRRMMIDPTHEHHEGWKRGLPASSKYIRQLYVKIPIGSQEVRFDNPECVSVANDFKPTGGGRRPPQRFCKKNEGIALKAI